MATKKDKEKKACIYTWVGINRKGKKVSGEMEAHSVTQAKAEMRRQGINPTKVRKKPKPLFGMDGSKAIIPADIAVFTRQVATHASSRCSFGSNARNDRHGHRKPSDEKAHH